MPNKNEDWEWDGKAAAAGKPKGKLGFQLSAQASKARDKTIATLHINSAQS